MLWPGGCRAEHRDGSSTRGLELGRLGPPHCCWNSLGGVGRLEGGSWRLGCRNLKHVALSPFPKTGHPPQDWRLGGAQIQTWDGGLAWLAPGGPVASPLALAVGPGTHWASQHLPVVGRAVGRGGVQLHFQVFPVFGQPGKPD